LKKSAINQVVKNNSILKLFNKTSAQNHISGIPEQFIEQKKEEIKKRQVIDKKINKMQKT
jgi:hypothetical protein